MEKQFKQQKSSETWWLYTNRRSETVNNHQLNNFKVFILKKLVNGNNPMHANACEKKTLLITEYCKHSIIERIHVWYIYLHLQ